MEKKAKTSAKVKVGVTRRGVFNKFTAPSGWFFDKGNGVCSKELYVTYPGDYKSKATLVKGEEIVARVNAKGNAKTNARTSASNNKEALPLERAMAKEREKANKANDVAKIANLKEALAFVTRNGSNNARVLARKLDGISEANKTALLTTLMSRTHGMFATGDDIAVIDIGNGTNAVFFLENEEED